MATVPTPASIPVYCETIFRVVSVVGNTVNGTDRAGNEYVFKVPPSTPSPEVGKSYTMRLTPIIA